MQKVAFDVFHKFLPNIGYPDAKIFSFWDNDEQFQILLFVLPHQYLDLQKIGGKVIICSSPAGIENYKRVSFVIALKFDIR